MDVNDLRIAVTLASLALFIALMAHTWSRRRREEHDAAALLPFMDEGGGDGRAGEAFRATVEPTAARPSAARQIRGETL